MKNFKHLLPKSNLIILISLILLTCCTGRKKSDDKSGDTLKSTEDGWTSLFDGKTLNGWEITSFGTEGPVNVSNGSIILGMGDGCTGVTLTDDFPKIDYEVSLEAKKISGNDFFCGMTFPVGDSWCSLIIGGWGGPVVGLSSVDGKDASENETNILKKFEHDTWYHILLRVSHKKIEAWTNDEKIIDFETDGHELSIRPEMMLSTPFGICSWNTTAALRNIKLKDNLLEK
jgi:hypothetical protein